MWCAPRPSVWTTKNPRVIDQGVSRGAGDENRTRALSLGSYGAWAGSMALTCDDALSGKGLSGRIAPLSTVAVCSYGHAAGTDATSSRAIRADDASAGRIG